MSKKPIGIGGAISMILGLIGTGIQMRWPDQKWIGTVFLIAAGVVALAVIVWLIARWHIGKDFEREQGQGGPAGKAGPLSITSHGQRGGITAHTVKNTSPKGNEKP